MRSTSFVRLTALAIAFVSPATFAEQVTYQFTGNVAMHNGSLQSIALGTAVSGSFTIDLDVLHSLPLGGDSFGDIGESAIWQRMLYNGTETTSALVSQTLTFNNTTYDSLPTGSSAARRA